jgi:hypothetical protein
MIAHRSHQYLPRWRPSRRLASLILTLSRVASLLPSDVEP